jgi:hypothetical protein
LGRLNVKRRGRHGSQGAVERDETRTHLVDHGDKLWEPATLHTLKRPKMQRCTPASAKNATLHTRMRPKKASPQGEQTQRSSVQLNHATPHGTTHTAWHHTHRMAAHETAWQCTTPHSTTRHRMAAHDTAWQCTTPHSTTRHRMAPHDIAWHRMAPHGSLGFRCTQNICIGHKFVTTAPTKTTSGTTNGNRQVQERPRMCW